MSTQSTPIPGDGDTKACGRRAPAPKPHEVTAFPDQAEYRKQPRTLSGRYVLLRSRDRWPASYLVATLWDVAAGGIGVRVRRSLTIGLSLDVRFQHLAVRDRVATVVRANQEGKDWLVGCTIEPPLNFLELRTLDG